MNPTARKRKVLKIESPPTSITLTWRIAFRRRSMRRCRECSNATNKKKIRQLAESPSNQKIPSKTDEQELRFYVATTRCPARNTAIVLLSIRHEWRAGEIAKLTWDMGLTPSGDRHHIVELHDKAAKKKSGPRFLFTRIYRSHERSCCAHRTARARPFKTSVVER